MNTTEVNNPVSSPLMTQRCNMEPGLNAAGIECDAPDVSGVSSHTVQLDPPVADAERGCVHDFLSQLLSSKNLRLG
jgi:hypothetical protein